MSPFLWLLILATLVTAFVLLRRRLGVPSPLPFVPRPDNDKVVVVAGWTEAELAQALKGFRDVHRDDLSPRVEIVTEPVGTDHFRLRFPKDIEPEAMAYLVAYLHRPEGLDATGRTLRVLGRTTLTPEFRLPFPELAGQRALVYLPEGASDLESVYVHAEGGATYLDAFGKYHWKAVPWPKIPPGLEELA